MIVNIHLKPNVHETGDLNSTRFAMYRDDVIRMKEQNSFSLEKMKNYFPMLFSRFPELIVPYLMKRKDTVAFADEDSTQWAKETKFDKKAVKARNRKEAGLD